MRKKRKSPERIPKRDYLAYINSQNWLVKKAQYRASKLPQKCLVCNSKKVDLHHRTYKRLGSEWLNDLIPLCRTHHQECHAFIESSKMGLWGGTKHYLRRASANL